MKRATAVVVLAALLLIIAPMADGDAALPPAPAATFPDVPASHPYYGAISELSSRSSITGYIDGRFGPTDAVVRQQFAKMIVLALELEPLPAEQCPFRDVEAGWPYPRGYIATAAERGITTGTTPSTFSPWDTISRAQVLTMVVRALSNLVPGTLRTPPAAFTGTLGSFDPTHGPTMATAEHNDLLEGLLGFGSSWDPWADATRGEVAQVLWNALQLQAAEADVSCRVSAGGYHSLAIGTDGSLWAWGLNDCGQVGDGTGTNRNEPVAIGVETDWRAVAAGGWHSLALKQDGSLWAWGSGSSGRLGLGHLGNLYAPTRVGTETDWMTVAAGGYHSLGLKQDGSLWAWGANADGRLGDGTTSDQFTPTRVGMETDWMTVAAGGYHSLALKQDGSLWAWGNNQDGQLGDGTTEARLEPTCIGTDTDWKAISAGRLYTLALKRDGSLWAWGANDSGQLGDGTTVAHHQPTRIGTGADWVFVAAGALHSLAVRRDGSLWAWGSGDGGRLGDGTAVSRHEPVRIGADTGWACVSASRSHDRGHSLALTGDGSLWAWGWNDAGQLGDGSLTNRLGPTPVGG